MKTYTEFFDAPLSSREHLMLRNEGWLVGARVTVRYYLGRLLGVNLFRKSDAEVTAELTAYIEKTISKTAADLIAVDPMQVWMLFDPILRNRFESQIERREKPTPREVQAVEIYLKNIAMTSSELAIQLKTTQKQIDRLSSLRFARSLIARARNHGIEL